MQRKTPAKVDVEVVTAEDLWAQFGSPLPDPAPAASPSHINYSGRRWGSKVVAILFTAGLHAVLVGTAMMGTAGRPPLKPINEEAAASIQRQDAVEFVSTLILLNDHSITLTDQSPDDSAYTASNSAQALAEDAKLLVSIDEPKPPELSGVEGGTDEASPTAEASGDEAGRAMLFGRYMGQVKARIERIWEYPSSTQVPSFDCTAQIKQSKQGDVLEITLQRCGDDPAWQVSLVQAIQRASPLSAAPSDSVYTSVLTLNFTAVSTIVARDAVR